MKSKASPAQTKRISRAALAQLLEYPFFYGDDSDRLCVVVNGPIADRRRAFLENLGVAVVAIDGHSVVTPIGQLAQEWFRRVLFQGSATRVKFDAVLSARTSPRVAAPLTARQSIAGDDGQPDPRAIGAACTQGR